MRGRIPKTREQRIKEGSTKHLPVAVRVSSRLQPGELPEPPMPLNADARAWWDETVPTLADGGVLERIDLPMLAMAAGAYGEVLACDRVIEARGMFALGSKGQLRTAPWVTQRRDAILTYERLAQHLCLSPVSRTRLGLAHLNGQVMQRELDETIGSPAGEFIDAEAVEVDPEDVGLPGV